MADSDYSGFSFPQTTSGGYHNGLSRSNGDEGSQYLQISGSNVDGYSHLFQPTSRTHMLQNGSNGPHVFGHSLSTEWQSGDVMSRWISQTSTRPVEMPQMSGGSTDSNYSEEFEPLALHRGLSQISYTCSSTTLGSPGSSSSLSDTAAYTSSPHFMDSQVYSELNASDSGDAVSQHANFHGTNGQIINGTDGSSFVFAGATEEIVFDSSLDLGSQMDMPSNLLMPSGLSFQEHLTLRHDSFSWDGTSSDSRTSSPTVYGSPIDNNFDTIINGADLYPSNSGLLAQQRCSNTDDFTTSIPTVGDEMSQGRRGSPENDNSARDHPLYHQPIGTDGFYHCPWKESDPNCTHKPEKLKCNYDKFVDSHLKPYRCKVSACENSKFSSTACLLRHEREAHGLHGHGSKPFLCVAEGCDRSFPGQGFPRHWNLRDHMKRVHHITPGPSDADQPVQKSRKRKTKIVETHLSTKRKRMASQTGDKVEPIVIKSSFGQEFDEERRQLIASVQHMDDLSDPEALQKLRLAKDILKNMASTSPRISASVGTLSNSKEQSG